MMYSTCASSSGCFMTHSRVRRACGSIIQDRQILGSTARAAAPGSPPRSPWSGAWRRRRGSCRSGATGPKALPLLTHGGSTADQAGPSARSARTPGWACRFSHHAGSPSPQPFGQGDEVRAVFEVADDHRVLPARPPPDGGQRHGAPLWVLRRTSRHCVTYSGRRRSGREPRRRLSSPLSSRARRSLPLRRRSAPSARRRSATWRLRRGSPCR